jgi:hypothetical protein
MTKLPDIVAFETHEAFPERLEMLDRIAYSWLDLHDLMSQGSPMRQLAGDNYLGRLTTTILAG